MRRDPRFGQAREIYKQRGKQTEAKPLFKALEKEYGYSEYSLRIYGAVE